MRKNQGFTLIELLITMALIGILLLIAIPRTDVFSPYYGNLELKNIRRDILATRARAIAEGKMHAFNILDNGYGYIIRDNQTKIIKTVNLDSVRILTPAKTVFYFNSQGGVANPNTVKIRCENNQIFELKVGVGTGKITLEKAED